MDPVPTDVIEVDMVSVADSGSMVTSGTSVIPAGTSMGGKRKLWMNLIDSSEGEDLIRTRSKQRRNNGNNREDPQPGSNRAFRKNPENPEEAMVTDLTSQSETDTRRPAKRVAKKKVQRDKKNSETCYRS